MSLVGKGKVLPQRRGGVYIYISKEVAKDSTFPFKPSEDVIVTIEKKGVIIKKHKKR